MEKTLRSQITSKLVEKLGIGWLVTSGKMDETLGRGIDITGQSRGITRPTHATYYVADDLVSIKFHTNKTLINRTILLALEFSTTLPIKIIT